MNFLFDKEEISEWAFLYCLHVEDKTEIKDYITDSFYSFMYCKYINDDPEVRKNITEKEWLYSYNINKKNFNLRINNEL